MSKRLQVVMDDGEYDEIRQAADARRLTVSAWVRQILRAARVAGAGSDEPGARQGRAATYATKAEADPIPDPALVRSVMERHGLASAAEAVDFALRRTAEPPLTRSDMLSLRGTGWAGDLAALRAHGHLGGDRPDEPPS